MLRDRSPTAYDNAAVSRRISLIATLHPQRRQPAGRSGSTSRRRALTFPAGTDNTLNLALIPASCDPGNDRILQFRGRTCTAGFGSSN